MELVKGFLEVIIDEAVGEEDGVVSHFDFFDCILNSKLELLLGLSPRPQSLSQLVKVWWVYEQVVALNGLLVYLYRALHVHFYYGDLVLLLDPVQLRERRPV